MRRSSDASLSLFSETRVVMANKVADLKDQLENAEDDLATLKKRYNKMAGSANVRHDFIAKAQADVAAVDARIADLGKDFMTVEEAAERLAQMQKVTIMKQKI